MTLPTQKSHAPALDPHGQPLFESREAWAGAFIFLSIVFLISGGVLFYEISVHSPSKGGDAIKFAWLMVAIGVVGLAFGIYNVVRQVTTYVCPSGIVEVVGNKVSKQIPWTSVTDVGHLTVHRAGVDMYFLRVLVGKDETRLAFPEGSDTRAIGEKAVAFWRAENDAKGRGDDPRGP